MIKLISQEKLRTRKVDPGETHWNYYTDKQSEKRSANTLSANKRYSSIHLSPKSHYGHAKPPNTAYTSNSRKRKMYYSKAREDLRINDSNTEAGKNYSVLDRRSATIESSFNHHGLGNPLMYKSKSRLQVASFLTWSRAVSTIYLRSSPTAGTSRVEPRLMSSGPR